MLFRRWGFDWALLLFSSFLFECFRRRGDIMTRVNIMPHRNIIFLSLSPALNANRSILDFRFVREILNPMLAIVTMLAI